MSGTQPITRFSKVMEICQANQDGWMRLAIAGLGPNPADPAKSNTKRLTMKVPGNKLLGIAAPRADSGDSVPRPVWADQPVPRGVERQLRAI